MTTPKDQHQSSAALAEEIFEHLVQAKHAPAQLAQKLGLSLSELAKWASQPKHSQVLESLARLADVRAQMLVSEYRASAAIRLIEIATDSEGGETSRKACVDLLRADLGVFQQAQNQSDEDQPTSQLSEEAILNAFQKLGEETST